MELKANQARIIDLVTAFDGAPVETAFGPVLWATVRIEYTLSGLAASVDIRVPVASEQSQTEADRRSEALRSARLLIDHACRAAGIVPEQQASGPAQDGTADTVASVLEGVAQELGLTEPTTRPKRKR